jgi:hypothetical protein
MVTKQTGVVGLASSAFGFGCLIDRLHAAALTAACWKSVTSRLIFVAVLAIIQL